nr:FIG00828063: hypothetical protein [Kibdelosporangium sp. MJ126-NF4]
MVVVRIDTPVVRQVVNRVNSCVVGLRSSRRVGPVVSKFFTVVTYQGRRSGRTFSTPVGYRRTGDVVRIGVVMPDAKKWWRNFTGDGGPIMLDVDGGRTGHAVARRVRSGRVEVTVHLNT